MKRMIIFCMLFFCSSMVLTAASPRKLKYKQILNTIKQLQTMVKDKGAELLHTPEDPVEDCLYTAVTCFKEGVQKLQPVSSQGNKQFARAIRVVSNLTYRDSGKQCESTCDTYMKKTPKEFLTGFEKLMQMLYKNEPRTHQS